MRRSPQASGYALLVVLVIVALAAAITATCIVAVGARQSIAAADASATTARAALQEALADACERVRWAPGARSGSSQAPYPPAGHWAAIWRPGGPTRSGFDSIDLDLSSVVGSSRGTLRATVELRSELCAQGVLVAGDMELHAPLRVTGSGVYSGGCIRGREWLRFGVEGATNAPVDGVHGDLWSRAAAHALGSIWAQGEEIHAPGSALPASQWASDSDTHGDARGLAELLRPPGPGLIQALGEHAMTPGDALVNGVLDLSRLPLRQTGRSAATTAAAEYVVLVRPENNAPLVIIGRRPPGASPITLLVDGDAAMGRSGSSSTAGLGALIVTGRLEILGPTRQMGHLYCGALMTRAEAVVVVPGDWRTHLLPGLAAPVIVALAKT